MSIKTLDWAFDLHIDNPGAKLVLLALANYDNSEGGSFPSLRKIEELTSIKQRTIATHLNYLEKIGIIERHERLLPNGGRASNLYKFCFGVLPNQQGDPPQTTEGDLPNQQGGTAESAGLSYPPDYPEDSELRSGASPAEKIIFPVETPNIEKHEVWTDFKALLIIQGNDDSAARKMIGKLIGSYKAERVSRCYTANRDLIYGQADAYGYFTEILKRDKKLNKDEGEIQTALREARLYHNQMYAGLDHIPPFDPANYVTRWPALQKYLDEVASGARAEPPQELKARQDEQKFNDQILEQARFYGRIK